jgi:hypothetical protein
MRSICIAAWLLFCTHVAHADPAARTIDLATLGDDVLMRVYGNLENGGSRGVPVAGGFDMDGDGHQDVAMASMLASPAGRSGAGEVFLIFGDGTITGSFDTAVPDARILHILGDVTSEAAGSEIWMDDVTGDGLGDLLIARQNFTPDASRIGAGALTIVVGDAALRTLAEAGTPIDLRAPPALLTIATAIGVAQTSRLGIWIRTGDVTGDGIADLVVGSDQEDSAAEAHHGAVYLLRGGEHLAATQTIDLAEFGSGSFALAALAAHVARVRPPAGANEFHFGATVHVADLDGNGRAEVLAAATIARTGAAITASGAPTGSAHDRRGAPDGTLYIAWDENFAGANWDALDLALDDPGVVATSINGGAANQSFGEEIAGGRDFDGDGAADLFGGDLVANADGRPPSSGLGHLLSGVDDLRDAHFDLDAPPPNVAITTFAGAVTAEISSDTAIDGDFDGDGRADLAFASPHAWPLGRAQAGVVHVFHGQVGAWPAFVDLADGALPPAASLRVTQVLGAHGAVQFDRGDTLAYSAAAGDLDDDGKMDLIINEMLGNGTAVDDAGTLIVVSGALVAPEPDGDALSVGALIAIAAVVRRRWFKSPRVARAA